MNNLNELFFDSTKKIYPHQNPSFFNSWESCKEQFEISDLRGMGRAAVVLRCMAKTNPLKNLVHQLNPENIGIYVLGEENDYADFQINNVLESTDSPGVDTLRKIPAKATLGEALSMVGAQLGIETGGRNLILGMNLDANSIDMMLEQLELDLLNQTIKAFLLAGFKGPSCEAAYLAFGTSWDQDIQRTLKRSLSLLV